jgi:hypothetical protein
MKVVEIRRWINFPWILSETVEQRRGNILMPSFSGSLSLTSRFDRVFPELYVVVSFCKSGQRSLEILCPRATSLDKKCEGSFYQSHLF